MRRRNLLLVLLIGTIWICGDRPAGAQSQRERLIIDNRSGSIIDIHVWAYNGTSWDWQYLATLDPDRWIAVHDVHQNKRFRAFLRARREYRYRTVNLSWDPKYGGPQDIWWVQ